MPSSSAASVRVFSRAEDTAAADDAARTIALAMCRDPQSPLWCKNPEDYYNDWWATAYNYQLRMPQQRFIYSLGSNTCVAYAYWYPEQKPEYGEGEGPLPEGGVDTATWERSEGMGLLADCLAFLKHGKSEFHKDKGSFLYLAYIGVRPDHQGRGLGSVMLQHLLDECDRQGKWAYLEASNDDNARLYKRFGFEATGQAMVCTLPHVLPDLQVTFTAMARAPKTAALS